MIFFAVEDLLEVNHNGWVVGIVDKKLEEDTIVVKYDSYVKSFKTYSAQLKPFRTNTEKLVGAENFIKSNNFMNFDRLITELNNFSAKPEEFSANCIIQFLRGRLYFGILQMFELDYSKFNHYIPSFKKILEKTFVLIKQIYSLPGMEFLDLKFEPNMNYFLAYQSCWPELNELLYLILGIHEKSIEFYNNYMSGTTSNGEFVYEKRKSYFNYAIKESSIETFFNKQNSLRFVYSFELTLKLYPFENQDFNSQRVFMNILEKFIDFLSFLSETEYKKYDFFCIENLFNTLENITNSNLIKSHKTFCHIKALSTIKSIKKKLDILMAIQSNLGQITEEVLIKMLESSFHIILLQHEELVKHSLFFFEKLLEVNRPIKVLLIEMINTCSSGTILGEVIKLVKKILQYFNENDRLEFLAETMKKIQTQETSILVSFCKKILRLSIENYPYVVSSITQTNAFNVVQMTSILFQIFSYKKLRIVAKKFISEVIHYVHGSNFWLEVISKLFSGIDLKEVIDDNIVNKLIQQLGI